MNFYDSLYPKLTEMGMDKWGRSLKVTLPQQFMEEHHGKAFQWLSAIENMPVIKPSQIELKNSVTIGSPADISHIIREELTAKLKAFHPWRKGPYNFFGINIDTEWRSDWKWDRLIPHIQPLEGRRVLDIGCGNGYHGWRMRGAGADFVLGVEPYILSVMQFQLIQKYTGDPQHHVIPLGIEDIPADLASFDTVFSMGLLYHRRSPIDHLLELKSTLRHGGELVLETLIIDGDQQAIFMPPDRYAKMRNVWFIPSIDAIKLWLERCGFKNINCVDATHTSCEEQRSTEWMQFESLPDFLDPENHEKTIEGHPAPLRAIFIATRG